MIAFSNISFAACNGAKIPLSVEKKEIFKELVVKDDVRFSIEFQSPFNICESSFTFSLQSSKGEVSAIRLHNKSKLELIVDSLSSNLSLFYLEIDGRKFAIKSNEAVALSTGPACSNNPKVYLNLKYIDTDGKEKFSHGHCPDTSQFDNKQVIKYDSIYSIMHYEH